MNIKNKIIIFHYSCKTYWYFQILNLFSIYCCDYMTKVTREYWLGHNRKRILKLGLITLWKKGK